MPKHRLPFKPMTLSEAREICSALGCSLTKTDGEYRVNFKNGREDSAYYTNHLPDAVHVAREYGKHPEYK